MSHDESERSPAGDPIYRHEEKSMAPVPRNAMVCEQIEAHVEKHIGAIDGVFHEIVSGVVHIDVHTIAPTDTRPWHTLITTGMSDRAMRVPADMEAPRYLELMMNLPREWQLTNESKQDERWYWPLRTLKELARLPHVFDTWFGHGHTVPNGDPAKPFASNTQLCGSIVVTSLLAPEAFHELSIGAQRIGFLAVVPLYREEMEFKLRKGAGALLERLFDAGITDLIDPQRKNVAKKLFGVF